MRYGRYQIIEELGKGAMGVVYKAHDPQIDRTIALKVLRQDRVISQEFVQRFLKEARAIGRLSHPSMVTVYDAGQDQGTIFIAMELLTGKSLREMMRMKRMGYQDIVRIGVQIAEALDYAHQKGIVHRDIKPSNIILDPDGRVKITDFGIARIEDPGSPHQTRAGEILGTPVYMSPEQVMGQPVDGRSDLYSLGVILYEMLTGEKPFQGENIAAIFNSIIQNKPAEPETTDSPIAQALSALIMKSINKDPVSRFQTGNEMAAPLKACLQRRQSDVRPQPVLARKLRPLRLLAFSAVILVTLLVVIIIIPSDRGGKPGDNSRQPTPTALLTVNSDPGGARVFIGSSYMGKTPLKLDLPLGKYEIKLSLQDHYDWEAQVQLDREGETPLNVNLVSMN